MAEYMKEEPSNAEVLNRAGIAGLALGAVSTAYMFIIQYLPSLIESRAADSVVSAFLWIAKFVGCIFIMKRFMTGLTSSFGGTERRHTLKLGVMASLLSALIFSAASLANVLYINPEEIGQAFDQVLGMYAGKLDSNSLAALDRLKDSMPAMTFFSNLIYCTAYGSVLATILSGTVSKKDPFADFHDGGNGDLEEQ